MFGTKDHLKSLEKKIAELCEYGYGHERPPYLKEQRNRCFVTSQELIKDTYKDPKASINAEAYRLYGHQYNDRLALLETAIASVKAYQERSIA